MTVSYCASITRREPSAFMNDAKFIIEQMHMASQDSAVGEQEIFCTLPME
jgi:hypothetical protein